jgi:WD40 repeat protein/class 3 adenylate cyclase
MAEQSPPAVVGVDSGPSGTEIKIFLIADVRGYTRFTQERGDEAAARLAARFAAVSREAVERWGGSVIELRGDEALAVFASPRQALRAAAELQSRFVEGTSAEPDLPLLVGIGLDAGEAVPVEGGYRGASLNVAARLCALAAPGEVLATQEIVHLARRVDGLRFLEQRPVRLKGIPHPVHTVKVVGDTANPYKGLRAFEETDAPDFFGREALTQQILARLAEGGERSRFLAVVGPSGSGKSSVVKAGVLPALRQGSLDGAGRYLVAEMVPGGQPIKELTAAVESLAESESPALDELRDGRGDLQSAVDPILPDDGELVLLIDQFEELFTLVEHEPLRGRFLELIENAVRAPQSRIRVIVTMRADFYDRPLLYKRFGDLVGARTQTVTPLAAEELERAISGPAERAGVVLEPGLVAQMVTDVGGEPGALPLLQYALTELFEQRRGSTMTLDGYRAIGGVSGALARRADSVYGELDEDQKEAARQLFLRLTATVVEEELARRRVPRSEVLSVDVGSTAMESAIEAFGAARLLSFDRDPVSGSPTVEVAHEALFREWGRLRGWLDAAREDLRTQRRVAAGAREWVDADRDASFLATGSRLVAFEAWQQSSGLAITPQEREFLDASLAERDRRQEEDDAREARERELERRSLRRLRAVVAVLAVAALLAAALTAFAFSQRGRAEREERVAVARELAAAAVANLEADPERSILLALEAVDRTRFDDGTVLPEAEDALHRAVVASRIVLSVPGIGGWLDWSPDGTRFVTEGPEETGEIDIRNAETGESVLSFAGHEEDVNGVAFSGDGSMLATTGDDGTAKVWDPETGRELGSVEGPEGPVLGPSFSPDGSLAAAAWLDEGTVRVWDVASSRPVHEIDALPAPFRTAFSPDGERLAIVGLDSSEGIVVDVRSGEEMFSLKGHEDHLQDVDWSPDGRWIATSSFDATVGIWDARTGDLRFSLFHEGPVVDADWSPDGGRLVTGGGDATVWEITEGGGKRLFSFSAQDTSSGIQGVAFSPDGNKVLTGDGAITAAKVWDVSLSGDAEWANVPGDPAWVTSVAFSPSGRELITSGPGGSVVEWDPETGKNIDTLEASRSSEEPPTIVDFDLSPDGAQIATMSYPTKVDVWDMATGQEVFSVTPGGFAESLDWSPDGRLLAIGAVDAGRATIVDRSGQEVAVLEETGDGVGVLDVQFSPDGQLLATASISTGRPDPLAQRVKIWDWESGETLTEISVAAEGMAFDPSGERIAIAYGGEAAIWDVDSGEKQTTLKGHEDALWDVAFSPDGSVLATAGFDNTVRIWDVDSGTQQLVLRGHDLVVGRLAFSPDGSKLASGAADGTARVWALDLDDLIRIAESELTRDLTEGECRQYLHGPCPEG